MEIRIAAMAEFHRSGIKEPLLWNCAAAAAGINRFAVYSADIIIPAFPEKSNEKPDAVFRGRRGDGRGLSQLDGRRPPARITAPGRGSCPAKPDGGDEQKGTLPFPSVILSAPLLSF